MRAALIDLVTGAACAGCGDPGRLLCAACRAGLDAGPWPTRPTPCPPGLAPAWAAGEYADLLRTLLLGHKEHQQLGLAGPLGDLLAAAVHALAADGCGPDGPDGLDGPLVLVPVPSRPASTRGRGHDPTYALVRHAARRLRRLGYDALPHRLLRVGPVLDQAGLDAAERAANLAGSMHCPGGGLVRLGRRRRAVRLVVCDDVLTTGATAREAQRALTAVGLPPLGIAVVAATRRRFTANLQPGSLAMSRPTD